MRIRLETARRLQGLNKKTKEKRAAAKAKRNAETRQRLEESGSHAFEIAPRVPKIKKNHLSRPNPPEAKFRKRQRGKTWLPTHMYHAKRAHMTPSGKPLWRFAIPLSPTEKSYRPTHRATGARGGVAWDMSYMSTIQLEGTEANLQNVLRAVGVDGEEAWGVKGKRWRAGTRSLHAWALERSAPQRPIAPITLIWCAKSTSLEADVEMVEADADAAPQQREKTKKNTKTRNYDKIWIRVHPSAFLELWTDLLELSKRQNPPVMVEDLRFEIGSIEVTGPGSTEALTATLRPLHEGNAGSATDSPEATWSSLRGVTNPSSLPRNALLAFSISDPRLHFPPTMTKSPTEESYLNELATLLATWPPDMTQSSPALFDRPARLAAVRRLASQKAINRRRTLAGPGVYPPAQPNDPRIPIIALSRRSGSQSSTSNSVGSWTILLPWKCVLPVWYSLMYYPLSSGGNLRFGGLKEQQQLAFEAGEAWFPGDFPGTRAGWEWELSERETAKREWERRPKGRRVEFDSADLGNGQKGEIGRGWACDWERLINHSPSATEAVQDDDAANGDDGRKKETDGESARSKDEASKKSAASSGLMPPNIYHLRPTDAAMLLNRPPHHSSTQTKISDENAALATVKISLVNRGTPAPRARIYRLPTNNPELRDKWVRLASKEAESGGSPGTTTTTQGKPKPKQKQTHRQPNPSQQQQQQQQQGNLQQLAASLITAPETSDDLHDHHLPLPPEEDLIGFVTTGNFNLAEGKGTGFGSILVERVLEDKDSLGKKRKPREAKMCIVRASGERVGRLGYWEVV